MKKVLFFLLCFLMVAGSKAQISTYSTKGYINTRLVLLPPYPLDFKDLVDQPGNQVIFQNISNLPTHISLNFALNSTDGNVSISSKKPIMSIFLGPRAIQSIPLNQLGEFINPNSLLVSGVTYQSIANNQSLPDGYYNLCITPLEYLTNAYIGQEACSSTFPVMALEPPVLRLTNPTQNDTVLNVNPQNLQFQWNLPTSLNPSLMTGVKTTLKIVEVVNNQSPEHAIQSSLFAINQNVLNGQTIFQYGPTLTPLIKGRRYAAVVQMTDSKGKVAFRNNGQSEVVSFVFGHTTDFSPLESQSSILTGTVEWAYRAVEETKDASNSPLVSSNSIPEFNREIAKDNAVGITRYPLADALVEVFGSDTRPAADGSGVVKAAIGTTKSDALGQYSLGLILKQAMKKYQYITIQISHSSGLFSKVVKTIPYDSLLNGLALAPTVLTGQTIELTPRVLLKDGSINNKVSINILLPEKQWSKYSLLSEAGLGTSQNTVTYNNQSYKVIATLTNGNTYKKLFQTINVNENYIAQINYPDKASAYFPIDGCYEGNSDRLEQKPVVEIAKNYLYDNTNQISGKISYNGKGRQDVRVSVSFDPKDVLGKLDSTVSITAISENQGYYTITGFPNLKTGSVIHFSLVDKTISSYPVVSELTIDKSGNLQKDFTIVVKKTTVYGHLTNKDGNAIKNALLQVVNSNRSTYSDDAGNYSIDLEQPEMAGNLTFIANGYKDSTIPVKQIVSGRHLKNAFLNIPNEGSSINRGTTVLDLLPSNASINISVIKLINQNIINRGTLTISSITGVSKPVSIDLSTIDTSAGFTFNVGVKNDPYGYVASFTPAPVDEKTLVPASINVSIAENVKNHPVIFGASSTIVINGIVVTKTPSGNNIPVTQQLVTVVNNSAYKAVSDKSGHFQLVLPANIPFVELQAGRTGFLTFDSTFKASSRNDTVILKNGIQQVFNKVLGFPASVTNIIKSTTDTAKYIISGYISAAKNKVFNYLNSNNLFFNNITVSVDSLVNAIPISTVVLQQGLTTAMQAYNYANVEATNIQLIADSVKKVTGQLQAELEMVPIPPLTSTFQLPNAILSNLTSTAKSTITTFAKSDINSLIDSAYRLNFDTLGFQAVNLHIPNMNDYLNIDTALFNIKGINNLDGYLKLDTILNFTPSNIGRIPITVGILGTDFSLNQLSFNNVINNVGQVILTASMQKIRASFNDIHISGLSTPNASLLFGGVMNLASGLDSIPFSLMGIVNTPVGTYLSSAISMIGHPIRFNGLSFTPIAGVTASFAYSTQNRTYNLNFAVDMNTDSDSSSSNPAVSGVTSSVFHSGPLVGQFNLQTSNWGIFVAANANQTVELGVATVNIGNLLFSIGSSASLNSMDSILQGTKLGNSAIAFDTKLVNAKSSDWAFGISGTVSFSAAPGMTGSGSNGGAIVLVSKTATYGFEARVDTLYMNIVTNTMIVSCGGSMMFDHEKKGFSLSANVVMKGIGATGGFAAGFKYFNYYPLFGGGIDLAASLNVGIEVPIGPVTYHSFGGGFDFNINAKVYSLFITGDLGPTGTSKELIDVSCYLGIQFSSACSYLPITTGSGSLAVSTINIAKADMTMDLCHRYFMVNINTNFALPDPLSSVSLSGTSTLFIAAPSPSIPKGCFYLQAEITLNVPFIAANASAGFGIGYNVSISNPYIPTSAMTKLASFVGSGTLNGFYSFTELQQGLSLGFNFNLAIFSAYMNVGESIHYDETYYANLTGDLTVRLSTNFREEINGGFGFSILWFGFSLGGDLQVAYGASASYQAGSGFRLLGYGDASLMLYGGIGAGALDARNMGCNSVSIHTDPICIDLGFLGSICFPFPDGVIGKLCVSLGIDFGIISGQKPYMNTHFKW